MNKFIVILALGLSSVLPAVAGPRWLTNLDEAKKVAAKENKPLFIDFTGSDWCGFCMKLEEEVFAKSAFSSFARDYVLVRLDFPHGKKLPAADVERNKAAQAKFGVGGFPAVVVLDSKGEEVLARASGYKPGSGPAAYLKQFKDVKKPKAGPETQKDKAGTKVGPGA